VNNSDSTPFENITQTTNSKNQNVNQIRTKKGKEYREYEKEDDLNLPKKDIDMVNDRFCGEL
jgi:NACalpha-BTF3-like transcription factor